jgi:small subunit ribosomal protein S6
LHTYEFMYILSPEVEEEDLEAVTTRVGQIIADGGGEVLRLEPWGRKRLAYPIKKFREGHYVLAHIQLDPGAVSQLRARLALTEEVIRYLLLRCEEMPPEAAPAATREEPASVQQPKEASASEVAKEPTEPPSEPAEEAAEPEAAQEQEAQNAEQTGLGD